MKRFQVCVKNRKCLSCVSFSKKIEGKSYQALIFNRSDTMVCAGDTIVNKTRCPCPHRTQSPTQETNIKHLISHLISIVKSDMEAQPLIPQFMNPTLMLRWLCMQVDFCFQWRRPGKRWISLFFFKSYQMVHAPQSPHFLELERVPGSHDLPYNAGCLQWQTHRSIPVCYCSFCSSHLEPYGGQWAWPDLELHYTVG